MPTVNINIDMAQFDRAQKAIDNLADRIVRPDIQVMRRIGETVLDDIDTRYMTRGYNTWPPLKESTIAAKKGNAFVLIDTGAMFASAKISGVAVGRVKVSVPYGGRTHNPNVPGYHQTGTRRMPQRKIVAVTPRLTTAVTATIGHWVSDMIKAFRKDMS